MRRWGVPGPRPHHLRVFWCFATVVLVLAVACAQLPAPQPSPTLAPVSITFLSAPIGGDFESPTWLGDSRKLGVVYIPPDLVNSRDTQLALLDVKQGTLQPLGIPPHAGCLSVENLFPTGLPDGRLGFLQDCFGPATDANPGIPDFLMVYNPQTGQTQDLVPYKLPIFSHEFSFSPDPRRGIISSGAVINERLLWLLPDHSEPVPLSVAFALAPSWSPDGTTIAFSAAPSDNGVQGVGRLDLPQSLYLMAGDGSHLRVLIPNIGSARGPAAWSPDSRWLALPVTPPEGPAGIWIIEVATGKHYRLLSDCNVGTTAWSPDGHTLAAYIGFACSDQATPTRHGIELITLPDLGSYASR